MTSLSYRTFALVSHEISFVGSGNTRRQTRATLLFVPCSQSRSCTLAFQWNRGVEHSAEERCDMMPEVLCLSLSESMIKQWGFKENSRNQLSLAVEKVQYRYGLAFCRELWEHLTVEQMWTVMQKNA